MAMPSVPVHSPDFQYRNAAQTDVTITWRAHGWKPSSEEAPNQIAIAPDGTRVELREVMRVGPPAAGSGFNLFGG